jgi:phosphoglycerate dehydrogenase-like enzyme
VTNPTNEPINVLLKIDFSDEIMNDIRAVSPRLHVERHYPKVPDKVWSTVDIMYSTSQLPEPEQVPRLRWVQLHSAGIDNLRTHPLMLADNVRFTTSSGIHAVQMAEYCLGMMLAFNLKIPTMLKYQARSEWQNRPPNSSDAHDLYNPHELRGQTLGIAGYGSIGRELARIARAMGMTVLATKRDLMNLRDDDFTEPGTGDPTGDIPDRLYPAEALASMVRECDFVVSTLPLTDATEHQFNAAVLAQMKPTAVLINVGRGGVIDEAALIEALTHGKIAGAGLDVFEQEPLPPESPLWKLENVIISPHVSGASVNYHRKAANLFIENLHRFLQGEPLMNEVGKQRGY